MGEGVRLTKLLPLLLLLLLLLAPEGGQGRKVRGARGREESYGARGGIQGGLAELLGGLLPNTYYSRPNYRYPYYDNTGKGYLLYGYGGKKLYEYSVFKPLEGYFK